MGQTMTSQILNGGAVTVSAKLIELEASDAERAYKSGNILKQIYGLEHFGKILEHNVGSSPIVADEVIYIDLAITYTRLGLLSQKMNNQENANIYFNKAVVFYKKTGKEIAVDKLVSLVKRMDENLQ